MAVPDLETWRAGWRSPDQQRLGVRPVMISPSRASIAVDLPYGDERDDDPLFATSALAYVADVVALSAVRAHLDDEREQPNGTASLHLNFVAAPTSTVTIEASVVAQNDMEAIVELIGREADGRNIVRGLVTFSVRQKTPGGAA
ncbi:MAG: hypothetical protein EXR68_01115 [Dehalococcoidia bacterium]|nr:hypothetical protein [Dehalococcoidia bacterium]